MQPKIFDAIPLQQPSLFEGDSQGSGPYLQCAGRIREALGEALRRCKRYDRHGVAAQMGRLTDQDISKSSIDAWVAPSRPDMRFPLELLPAFISTVGSAEPLRVVAAVCGYTIVGPDEEDLVELARVEAHITELQQRRERLKSKARTYFDRKEGRR